MLVMHVGATLTQMLENQYNIGRRGCALMSSLLKANWDRQTGGQAQVSIGIKGVHNAPIFVMN
jgi:hypothetical protein